MPDVDEVPSSLELEGFRGFATETTIELAVPNGEKGSGITTLVGPNNSGKTTVIEALRAISHTQTPSFQIGQRNAHADGGVRIQLTLENGEETGVQSLEGRGSQTRPVNPDLRANRLDIYVLPSRRKFSPHFSRGTHDREGYIRRHQPLGKTRDTELNNFSGRLVHAYEKDDDEFDEVLEEILGYELSWYIDQDSAGHFVAVEKESTSHNSDGLGEGLVSLLFIVDALYDSNPGEIVVIDEPELSLHPSLQKRVMEAVLRYSQDRQIVFATHSPYFVNWDALSNGAELYRLRDDGEDCSVHRLRPETINELDALREDLHKPHLLGLKAREAFFLPDHVTVVEGQEDAYLYPKLADELGIELSGEVFGWGVGGEGNFPKVFRMLDDLGFQHVAGILDGNVEEKIEELDDEFPQYGFVSIPTEDIRDKPDKTGMVDRSGEMKEEYREPLRNVLSSVSTVLEGG